VEPSRDTYLTDTEAEKLSDRQLVEATLSDRRVYAHIVKRYKAPLGRYVRRLLGWYRESADDMLQEVFIRVYLNLNDYDQTRPFSPWIYRIAHNETVSLLRKRNAEPPVVAGDDAQLILEHVSSDDNPAAGWAERRTAHEIQNALAALDARYRDVLVLRFLEEKTYDEIADILQIPPGTVATFISRGLKQLKMPLKESWESFQTGTISDRP
jgi:RNA polymerase sigma-70 factor, ECF subfamily